MKRRNKEKRPKKLFGAMADRKNEEIPSFTRILSKHGLCAADLPVCEAFNLFTRIASDSVVKLLKPKTVIPKTNVLGIYSRTAAALDKMNAAQKTALLERLEDNFRVPEYR